MYRSVRGARGVVGKVLTVYWGGHWRGSIVVEYWRVLAGYQGTCSEGQNWVLEGSQGTGTRGGFKRGTCGYQGADTAFWGALEGYSTGTLGVLEGHSRGTLGLI